MAIDRGTYLRGVDGKQVQFEYEAEWNQRGQDVVWSARVRRQGVLKGAMAGRIRYRGPDASRREVLENIFHSIDNINVAD